MPNFERNEETLQALLTLASLNESADEQGSQLDRIEKTALQSLSKPNSAINDEVFHAMQIELVNETHLDTLAESIVSLDCSSTNILHMGKKIIDLTSTQFDMAQQLEGAEYQLDALEKEQVHVAKLIEELKSEQFQPPTEVSQNIAEWTKSAKQLRAKIAEYEERLSASRPTTTTGGSQGVQQDLEDLSRLRSRLASLEVELRAFQDLPPDSRAARHKLEEARSELREATHRRDRLFEVLAET